MTGPRPDTLPEVIEHNRAGFDIRQQLRDGRGTPP
jgi:hypothetical protein